MFPAFLNLLFPAVEVTDKILSIDCITVLFKVVC